jgi:hypothetical protein
MAIHQYYESVPEANDRFEQKMAQLMCKIINHKRKSFDTNFGKMVCMVDPAFGPEILKEILNRYDLKGE